MEFPEKEIPQKIGSYILKEKLGKGSFSEVFLAIHEFTDTPVAIKIIKKNPQNFEKILHELEILKTIDHPFIISFFEFLENEKNFFFVMEYVSGGSLMRQINNIGALPELLCSHYFCQINSD